MPMSSRFNVPYCAFRRFEQSENLFRRSNTMCRRYFVAGCLAGAIIAIEVGSAAAQDAVKIGVVIPMTGAFAAVGREVAAGAKLYIQQHGDTVAGQKIELIIRDDAGVPDNGKRLARELIVKERVSFLDAGITYRLLA